MLENLNILLSGEDQLRKDLVRYDLKEMVNIVALDRIKKAFLKAKSHIKTEQDLMDCKISLYGSLQKLKRLEINLDDTDLWFVNVYKKEIKADYMYQALLNSASRRGFPCFATFEYILKDEKFSTSRTPNGRIQINYEDEGLPKNITLKNINDYRIFFLLLNVHNGGKLIHQVKVQMTPEEILKIKSKSTTKDKGETIKYFDGYGNEKSYLKKTESVWEEWTKPQINKTLVKQAFNVLKESIPTLSELMKFEDLEDEDVSSSEKTEIVVNEAEDSDDTVARVNLSSPPEEIKTEAKKIEEEFKITPELVESVKRKLWEGMKFCKTEDHITMFLNANAPSILALGDESRKKVEEEIKKIEAGIKKGK